MKWFKRILVSFLVVLVLLVVSGWIYVQSLKPDYDENLELLGLESEVQVYYDDYGIPHIQAQSNKDAWLALGYVHAKERLWQMECIRRIAPGRLSEAFGESMVETDRFFRTLRINDYSKKSVEYYHNFTNQKVKELVSAYLKGVNLYVRDGQTPIEYHLSGLKKSEFSELDVFNVMGYMSFSFALAHKTEPILDFILNSYGREYLNDLDVHVDTSTTLIRGNRVADLRALSIRTNDILSNLPSPELIGSNSWVLGPTLSESGEVILANDPHIGFGQPAVWYEAHIKTPEISHYGNYLAGYPFAQVGHSDRMAIGLTMFENDDIDYYRERVNPADSTSYEVEGAWVKFDIKEEEIKVKGGSVVQFQTRATRHGPVINDAVPSIRGDDPVAMYWVYQKFPNRNLEMSYDLITATSIDEVAEAAAMLHAPGLNIMYGDADGNIAWWAAAKLPKRPTHVNSKIILDGASGKDDIREYYPFEDNPQAINPASGYVYSANNQSVTEDLLVHPGYYLPEDRARRIVRLLDESKKWSVDDVKAMQLDVTSENAKEIVQTILVGLDQSKLGNEYDEVKDVLSNWDGSFGEAKVAPVIYYKLLYKIIEYGLKDELGESFDVFNGTHLMKRSIQPLLANKSSQWWDDLSTDSQESRSHIFTKAWIDGMEELSSQLGPDMTDWRWGAVHTLEHEHTFSSINWLKKYFNVGPFEVDGTTEVINNLQFIMTPDGQYDVKAGPSCRRIVHFEDVSNDSWSILPTGQSGRFMSPHYRDQAEMYVNGEFRKKLMNWDEIEKESPHLTILSPPK